MICRCAGSPATARSSQSRNATRLVLEAGAHERVDRERRVAQPAVAVVPVAHAADLLGERGRGRGDDAAGRRVGERLQRDRRAQHRVAPLAVVGAAGRPVAARTRSCGRARRRPAADLGPRQVRRRAGQHERHPVARAHCELGGVAEVVALRSAPAWRRRSACGPPTNVTLPSIVRTHGRMLP